MASKTKSRHYEHHKSAQLGWLRAAVMGANDGIVSTASLLVGVAAAGSSRETLLLTGLAGLVAGAMSMAAGEYVSVSSQSDLEKADLQKEMHELETNTEYEIQELSHIYMDRGLSAELARQVAEELMKHDALGSHARDELGITELSTAKPTLAALTSAVTFAVGAFFPLLVALFAPDQGLATWISSSSLVFLIGLGFLAAQAGGANPWRGAARVFFWSALAMLLTALVGRWFGTTLN
ncbi:MAG: VIT family protein [Bdellovibrionales bacterium]